MAVREYKSITIGPDRILRIEAQDAIPDRVDQRRERHRRAWVTGFGLLHRVDRKRSNRVYAKTVEGRILFECAPLHVQGRVKTTHCSSGHSRLAVIWKSVIRNPSGNRINPFQERANLALGSISAGSMFDRR